MLSRSHEQRQSLRHFCGGQKLNPRARGGRRDPMETNTRTTRGGVDEPLKQDIRDPWMTAQAKFKQRPN